MMTRNKPLLDWQTIKGAHWGLGLTTINLPLSSSRPAIPSSVGSTRLVDGIQPEIGMRNYP
jgi:hypothetical protein